MAYQPALQAQRALVKVLLLIASVYRVVLDLKCDSCDADVLRGFKKVLLKAHPDKGGSEEHAKRLNTAKGEWDEAKKSNGRPAEKPNQGDSNEIIPGGEVQHGACHVAVQVFQNQSGLRWYA